MRKFLLFVGLAIFSVSCTKELHLYNGKLFFTRKVENREPNFINRKRVGLFFAKWYAKSKPITNQEFCKLDAASQFGYSIYESFISDTLLNNCLREPNTEYFLVPFKINVQVTTSNFQRLQNDSILKKTNSVRNDFVHLAIGFKELNNFRPRITVKKCLYYFSEYQSKFPNFSARYGVKPFLSVYSPLMRGGTRFYESSPLVYDIIILKDTGNVIIDYSIGTDDYRSLYEYSNSHLRFLKHLMILAID